MSLYFSAAIFNYIQEHEALKSNALFYDNFSIILINPNDDIKERVSFSDDNAIFKTTYEEIDGTYIRTIITTSSGLIYGLPIYDNELTFIRLNNIDSLEPDVLYSNHPNINNLENIEITYPSNSFINKPVDSIINFKVDNTLKIGDIYLIKEDSTLRQYITSKNRWNHLGTSFTGDSAFLKNDYLSKYNVFMIILGLITFLPVLLITIIFNIFTKYQIERRNRELLIQSVYFAKNKKVFLNLMTEFVILIIPITVIVVSLVGLIYQINFKYIVMILMILSGFYLLSYALNILRKLYRLSTKDKLELFQKELR